MDELLFSEVNCSMHIAGEMWFGCAVHYVDKMNNKPHHN